MRGVKRYKMLVVDVDGVLTNEPSIWQYIHRQLGTEDQAKPFRSMFFSGKLTYSEWASKEASLWSGTPLDELKGVLSRVEVRRGAKELVEVARGHGLQVLAISAGLDILVHMIAEELRIDHVIANELVSENGVVTGEVRVKVGIYSKGRVLYNFARQLGFSSDEIIVVGDSSVDVPMMNLAAFSIGFSPISTEVYTHAHVIFQGPDLYPVARFLDVFLAGNPARG